MTEFNLQEKGGEAWLYNEPGQAYNAPVSVQSGNTLRYNSAGTDITFSLINKS